MIPFINLLALLIPFGLGLLILFAAILAHRGFATKGTWTVLISICGYFLSVVALLALSFIGAPHSMGSILSLFGWLITLSAFSLGIGAFLMTMHWKTLSQETADLEKLALQLAAERDELQRHSDSA
ncbi:MAG: hypothetical protein ACSHYB_15185 [Roseibacillus sp.]